MVKRNKIVIVLGGFGFIGKQVVRELKKRNYSPVALSRRNGCDVTKTYSFVKILKREAPFAIINCAAHVGSVHYAMKYAAEVIRDNMRIITSLYEAVKIANRLIKIINPISNCSYPGEANIHYEPDWQKGKVHDSVLSFASTRRMIHAFAQCYYGQYGVRSVNWLVANSFGPGDYTDPNKVHALNGILIRLIKAQKRGEKVFEIWGSGKPLREWVYVDDASRILAESLKIEEQIYPLNFAQNKAYSITEIAEIGAKILNFRVKLIFNTTYPDGAMYKILDDRRFRAKFPRFKFTPLEEGIMNTIRYYKALL